jgi:hypothetical protein
MKFIQGQDRDQAHLFPTSLDQAIEADNVVRIIDMFVDSLDLEQFGFKTIYSKYGSPAPNLKRVVNIVGRRALTKHFQALFAQLSAKITTQNCFESLKAKLWRPETFLVNIFEKSVFQVNFNRNMDLSAVLRRTAVEGNQKSIIWN